jgi:DnaJ-class molecular chaperone
VLQKQSAPEEKTRDAEMELPLCALGLFTGGRVSVLDHLGEKVSITIPPGYNPSEPFKIDGHGYGSLQRGALIVKIVPVFKQPANLNQHERQQLQRLNEMART